MSSSLLPAGICQGPGTRSPGWELRWQLAPVAGTPGWWLQRAQAGGPALQTVKPAFSGARRVCVGAGLPERRAQRPVSPPIHHIGTPSCVSVPRTLVTSMSRCARDPPPRESSPRCARGAPGGEREPHPVKKAPVPPPSRPQLKRLEGGGGEREVLAGAKPGSRGSRGGSSQTPAR